MMTINENHETIFSCRHCGEEYASLPENITDINNGVELWIDQEYQNHLQFCEGDEEEQRWKANVNRLFRERRLTREEYKELYSEHRANDIHYSCFHYMLSQPAQRTKTAAQVIAEKRRRRSRR